MAPIGSVVAVATLLLASGCAERRTLPSHPCTACLFTRTAHQEGSGARPLRQTDAPTGRVAGWPPTGSKNAGMQDHLRWWAQSVQADAVHTHLMAKKIGDSS
jgi:hypothetical protein